MDNSSSSEWERASLFARWTFSVANLMLQKGDLGILEYDDLMRIPSNDQSRKLMLNLKKHLVYSKPFLFLPRLLVALFNSSRTYWIYITIFSLFEGMVRVFLPISLIFFLRALQDSNASHLQYIWAGVISCLGLSQTLMHHILFFYSMRVGWNWRNACTALIHDQLFYLNSNVLQSSGTGTGKLVNLISNDVARFDEFAVVSFSINNQYNLFYFIIMSNSLPHFSGNLYLS
jgi:ATP-binding cassette subfamily C (CFTR/MRP) protein 4